MPATPAQTFRKIKPPATMEDADDFLARVEEASKN